MWFRVDDDAEAPTVDEQSMKLTDYCRHRLDRSEKDGVRVSHTHFRNALQLLLVDETSPLTTGGDDVLIGMVDDCLAPNENASTYPGLLRLAERWADGRTDCLDERWNDGRTDWLAD